MFDNMYSMFTEYLLFYLCDTDEGSSGAPVVKTQNKHRYVVGLHRGWKKLNGNNYNYGTLMSTIVDHIEGGLDPIYCECHVTTFSALSFVL